MYDLQMSSLKGLHDATLTSFEFTWKSGTLRFSFETCATESIVAVLELHGVTELKCPRTFPWGPSTSVNTVSLEALAEGRQLLKVEMQSGDLLEARCQKVLLPPCVD